MKAIIFDLDNCLCPASAVGPDFFEPAFAAVRAANLGVLSEAALERAFAECWYTAFDAVALQFGFSKGMVDAGHAAFARLEVTSSLAGYADLPIVRELPGKRYLVTSGFRKLQESRIRALGIATWFDNVVVDAIDEPDHLGKEKIFEAILTQGPWCADEVMVVGDNPRSELAAGRRLGMVTVQILRPGVSRCADVDHHAASLEELQALLALGAAAPRTQALWVAILHTMPGPPRRVSERPLSEKFSSDWSWPRQAGRLRARQQSFGVVT